MDGEGGTRLYNNNGNERLKIYDLNKKVFVFYFFKPGDFIHTSCTYILCILLLYQNNRIILHNTMLAAEIFKYFCYMFYLYICIFPILFKGLHIIPDITPGDQISNASTIQYLRYVPVILQQFPDRHPNRQYNRLAFDRSPPT